MSVIPRLSPKSLNEWTLEQNIVREIANIFDTPFGIFYPVRLRNIFDIRRFDYSRFRQNKTKSYKLTPREEGSGGGWDTKFVIPGRLGNDSRAIYIQFKCGSHSDGNNIVGSIFNLQRENPNPHMEFSFNDNGNPSKNKKPTQHDDLKKLNDYLVSQGFSSNAVLYAFPRIKDLETFDKLLNPIIYYTTFLSHTQMDSEAAKNSINLYDGNLHHFRTCYIDDKKCEISSQPFQLTDTNNFIGLMQEIMIVKLSRVWNNQTEYINPKRLKDYLIFSLCEELSLNPYQIDDEPFNIYTLDEGYEFDLYFKELEANRIQNERLVFERTDNVINRSREILYKNVRNYINELDGKININTDVPKSYTTPLNVEYRNPLNTTSDFQLGDVSITSIVF